MRFLKFFMLQAQLADPQDILVGHWSLPAGNFGLCFKLSLDKSSNRARTVLVDAYEELGISWINLKMREGQTFKVRL